MSAAPELEAPAMAGSRPAGLSPLWSERASLARSASMGDPIARPLASAISLPEDQYWEAWSAPAVNGLTQALGEWQGKLVLGGSFRVAGDQYSGGVVLWNGTNFELLPPTNFVRAVTVWNDQLVVAAFRSGASYDILRYNGTSWDTLGTANQEVGRMLAYDGALVIGGRFSSVSGVPAVAIAKFDGGTWSQLGTGLGASEVIGLTVHAGKLVVSGSLFAMGNIASLDDATQTWSTIGAGFNARVWSVVSDGPYLYASGEFSNSGGSPMVQFARWDGVQWTQLWPYPAGGFQIAPMALWNGGVVVTSASGASRLGFWNGTTFSQLPDSISFGQPNLIAHLGTWGGQLVVAGNFFNNGSTIVPSILLYDGVSWTTIGESWGASMKSPSIGTMGDMLAWGDKLVVGGGFGLAADTDHYSAILGLGLWNRTHWSSTGRGVRAQYRVLGTWSDDLIVAGGLLSIDGTSIQRVARWDGANWSGFGTSAPDFGLAIQEFKGQLHVGHDDLAGGGLSRWNGASWEVVGGGLDQLNFSGWAGALCANADSLFVGGRFTGAGGTLASNIAVWDGSQWHAMGAGFNNTVDAVCLWNGRVVAGGRFTSSGAQLMPGAAIWNGSTWEQMGTTAVSVSRLRVSEGALFGSGVFRLPDNSTTTTVARWTGTDWRVLGSGPGGGFEIYDGHLYQAGSGVVHGHVSHNLARIPLWATLDTPELQPGETTLQFSALSNPVRGPVALRFTLPSAGRAQLTVHDLAGREVALVLDRVLDAGEHTVRWSVTAPPGVYFARLLGPDGKARVTRVVRLE